ncbi:MAG: 4'-phosphopantetheinyl transferase superfamily protein [Gammaproteobacteria bacterium]|jgi:4'-phosphopantetheinyl transferase EntD|nr:4'-phosphopantetheinyl transferase superfamily protein [Gammaproteobacteria bacterium]
MTAAAALQELLVDLLPGGIAVAVSDECPANAELLGAEATAAAGMVEARRREFAHGRHCARQALRQLGAPPTSIPKGDDRAPQWPPGIVGSISHTGSLAAAVVARTPGFAGVGLDIEAAGLLESDALKLILRDEEQASYSAADGRLLFSIKEAIYKCIYPQVQRYVDFREMHVTLDPRRERFSARPCLETPATGLPTRLEGLYRRTDTYVISVLWLET